MSNFFTTHQALEKESKSPRQASSDPGLRVDGQKREITHITVLTTSQNQGLWIGLLFYGRDGAKYINRRIVFLRHSDWPTFWLGGDISTHD